MKTLVRTYYREDWDYEDEMLTILDKDDILLFHPRYILKCKPNGLTQFGDTYYVRFQTPKTVPGNKFLPGRYAVSVKDLKEILASLPHFPNKKESKQLRKSAKLKGH